MFRRVGTLRGATCRRRADAGGRCRDGRHGDPVLLPGLVAAAVGYVVFIGLGDWGGFPTTALSFSGLPPYDGTRLVDPLLAVVVGVLTAMLVAAVRLVAHRVADMDQSRLRMPGLLLVGGVTVGAIAYLADALGADSQDVLFSGQTAIPSLVTEGSAKIVLTLLAAKALAYAISLGCGFRGGPVFPAIFLGVAIATLGVQWLDMSPTFAVAIGTAAGMAAMTRLLIASLLFSALLVGTEGLDALPGAVLAAASAWVFTTAITQRARGADGATGSPGEAKRTV
jgi:H+/Cl- antiporter ClcA